MGKRKYNIEDRDSYAVRYLSGSASAAIIAEDVGVSLSTIVRWAKEYKRRHPKEKIERMERDKKLTKNINKWSISERDGYVWEYLTGNLTQKELCDKIGVNKATFKQWVKEYKISHPEELKTLPKKHRRVGEKNSTWFAEEREAFVREYIENGHLSYDGMSRKYGINPSTFCRWVKEYEREHGMEVAKKKNTKWSISERDGYVREYLTGNLTQKEIADKIGVSIATITRWIRAYKIRHPEEVRTLPVKIRGGEKTGGRRRKCNVEERDSYAVRYLSGSVSAAIIAQDVGVTEVTIRNWAKDYKIRHPEEASILPIKKTGKRCKCNVEERDSYAIRYLSGSVSAAAIAEDVGVTEVTIRNWAKEYKIRHPEEKIERMVRSKKTNKKRLTSDLTLKDLADTIGVTPSTILRWAKDYKLRHPEKKSERIARDKKATKNSKRSIEERDKYARQYLTGSLTQKELADKIGVSQATIVQWIKEYKIRYPEEFRILSAEHQVERNSKWSVQEREDFVREYIENDHLSYSGMSRKYGIDPATFHWWVQKYERKYGIEIKRKYKASSQWTVEERDGYVRQYLAGSLTQKEIADNIGVNQATILRWIKEYKIRHPEEASSLPVNNS